MRDRHYLTAVHALFAVHADRELHSRHVYAELPMIPRRAVRKKLLRLLHLGHLDRTADGYYRVTLAGYAAAEVG